MRPSSGALATSPGEPQAMCGSAPAGTPPHHMATWAVRIPPRPRPRSLAGVGVTGAATAWLPRSDIVEEAVSKSKGRQRLRRNAEISDEISRKTVEDARLDVETGGVSVETGDVSVEFPRKCKHFLKRQIADQNRSNISDDGRFHAIDAKSQTNFDLDLA